MLLYSEIVEKLKDILSQELGNKKIEDKDVAEVLGINYNNFRQQKHRDIYIPYSEIMQFLAKRNISINWFFFNQLPESLIDATSNFILLKYQKDINVSAGAGVINYTLNSSSFIVDKQMLDYLQSEYSYTEIIKVYGDSMEPDIKDDSLIFVDTSKKEISPGTFVINTSDGLLVKKIKQKDKKIYLQSTNDLYSDIEADEIKIVGKVTGVLTKV